MERGTATLGIMVAEKFLKKRKITMTTRAMVSIISNGTSCTEERMVWVRSVRIATLTDEGSEAWSTGNSFLMRSATVIMLAPGWRWMFMMTAGERSIHAACLTFSALSITVATSERRIGAPSL